MTYYLLNITYMRIPYNGHWLPILNLLELSHGGPWAESCVNTLPSLLAEPLIPVMKFVVEVPVNP